MTEESKGSLSVILLLMSFSIYFIYLEEGKEKKQQHPDLIPKHVIFQIYSALLFINNLLL